MKPNYTHINTLVAACKLQDKNAQMELYNCYYKAMYNTSCRILNDRFEAEDIMQEAFLTAFTKINSFRGEVSFGAWLKRIVINKSLSQLKKRNPHKNIAVDTVESIETNTSNNYASIDTKTILTAISKLKDNYRIVITLHFMEGYDYDEIASITNYSNENVRTTIHRAKQKLKQLLPEKANLYI